MRFPPPAHDLVVIRHGQTDWNAARRLQGREDVPLNVVGRGQARGNGAALKRRLEAAGVDPAEYDYVSSPLGRAAETMRLVREELGLDPLAFRMDERLVELDFGSWSGLHLEEIALHDPAGHAARARDKWNVAPPGGESHAEALCRVGPLLTALARPTVLVAHGGVNRVIKVLLGLLDHRAAADFFTPQDRFWVWSGGTVEWVEGVEERASRGEAS